MLRVARPEMKVPYGWYLDWCRGHWKRESCCRHLSAVFSCGRARPECEHAVLIAHEG